MVQKISDLLSAFVCGGNVIVYGTNHSLVCEENIYSHLSVACLLKNKCKNSSLKVPDKGKRNTLPGQQPLPELCFALSALPFFYATE